jgi:hypothetical protein
MEINKYCIKCNIELNVENKINKRNLCKSCNKIICKEYKHNNKEKISEYNKTYKENNKEVIAEYNKEYHKKNLKTIQSRHNINSKIRRNKDPGFKLAQNCRNKIRKLLRNNLSSFKLLDCSKEFLIEWLKYSFTDEMNFENYGTCWHVDHVIPCARFNLENEDDIKFCFRWTNLQPLYANKNLEKKDKIIISDIKKHYEKVQEYIITKNIQHININYIKYI